MTTRSTSHVSSLREQKLLGFNDERIQLYDLIKRERTFRDACDWLFRIMQANDAEIEVSVALNHLAGKRKREEHSANSEESPPAKISKVSTDSSAQQCPGAPRLTPRRLHQPDYLPQRLTKESLQVVRDRLSSLTFRNNEIKESIQHLRNTVIDDLFSHMKIRQIAIGQLGSHGLDEDMHQLCTTALWARKAEIYSKQQELTTLEELLGGHKAILDFVDSAYEELEHNLKLLDTTMTAAQYSALSAYDFPNMSALARLTGGIKSQYPPIQVPDLPRSRRRANVFPLFARLPPEVRLLIWQEALPGPRIITHNSKHNRHFAILAVNREARNSILTRLTQLLSPTFDMAKTDTRIIHTNLKTDIIIRDLANPLGPDAFELETMSFNAVCYRLFIGLAKVKHLALAFDVLKQNGGQLFGPLQTCCPELETLIIFPSSMVEGSPFKMPKQSSHHTLKFIDMDSNVIDHVYQRYEQLRDRTLRRKAIRGIAVFETFYGHRQQYHRVFPEYIKQYGHSWAPKIKISLMVKWNEKCNAWQTRYLDGDKYSKGYRGVDGRLYRGFVESGMMCGEDGEVLSRYDGMERMFEGLTI